MLKLTLTLLVNYRISITLLHKLIIKLCVKNTSATISSINNTFYPKQEKSSKSNDKC